MKKLLSIMAMLWIGILTFGVKAQSTQLATLQHQEQVSVYYGPEALKQALAVADNGDVITLSAGQFDAADINKELTIRGAGMGIESAEGYTIPTTINSSWNINQSATLEGIISPAPSVVTIKRNISLIKCDIGDLRISTSSTVATIIQSVICAGSLIDCQINAINSVFTGFKPYFGYNSKKFRANLTNCILDYSKYAMTNGLNGTTLVNCIVKLSSSCKYLIGELSAAYNTLICGKNNDVDFCTEAGNNVIRKDIRTVFKEEGYYELLDEFKTMTTTDGKEPGIHGGSLGFSQVPNNPQITKFTVAPKTSVDGKLSVEIEVEGLD